MNSNTTKDTGKGTPKKHRNKKNGFSLEGARYIRDEVRGITLQARAVLYDANVRANARHEFFVRIDTWADDLEIGESTLRRHVSELVDKGFLERYRQFKRSNRYRVLPNSPKWRKNPDACRSSVSDTHSSSVSDAHSSSVSDAHSSSVSDAHSSLVSALKTTSSKDSLKVKSKDLEIDSAESASRDSADSDHLILECTLAEEDDNSYGEPPNLPTVKVIAEDGTVPIVADGLCHETEQLVRDFRYQCVGSCPARVKFWYKLGRLHFPKAKRFKRGKALKEIELGLLNQIFVDFGLIACEFLAVAFRDWNLFTEGSPDLEDIHHLLWSILPTWAEEANPTRCLEMLDGEIVSPDEFTQRFHDAYFEADMDYLRRIPDVSAGDAGYRGPSATAIRAALAKQNVTQTAAA